MLITNFTQCCVFHFLGRPKSQFGWSLTNDQQKEREFSVSFSDQKWLNRVGGCLATESFAANGNETLATATRNRLQQKPKMYMGLSVAICVCVCLSLFFKFGRAGNNNIHSKTSC